MSKKDWLESPAWAKALAQDANGRWHWYSCKPDALLKDGVWGMLVPRPFSGELFQDAGRDEPNENWMHTLEEKP